MSGAPPKYRRYAPEDRQDMLIEAGLACLADGGMPGFTIERICAAAGGASRGLVAHHFGSKQGLLRACYTAAYDRLLGNAAPGRKADADLGEMIEALLADAYTTPETLRAWLVLWGEVANDADLMAEHRRYYDHYRGCVAAALEKAAGARGLPVPASDLAIMFISLVDGLWLERCLDPERLSREDVRRACTTFLAPYLGPDTGL